MMPVVVKYFFCILFLLCIFSCTEKKKDVTLFQLMENTGIDFQNNVEDGSKDNSFLFRNFYNGGGVAIGDINNDGLADVFLTANAGYNKLYLNKGNFQFEDISDKAGIIKDSIWNTGVVFADVNSDGWLDIYVCASGHMSNGYRKNKLYINNQNKTFTESADQYGLGISAYSTQVSFFDYDLDGDLDCFMINNSPVPVNQLSFSNKRDLPEKDWAVADFLKGGGDHLFRNDNGKFIEVTKEAGIHGTLISFGLGVSVSDINNDGYPDVFVSNDSYERDYLYINQKNGTFKDELENWMQHVSFSSMGADIADINNDGYVDLFTTDMFPMGEHRLKTMGAFDNINLFNAKLDAGFYYQYPVNCLQLNNGNGKFKDIARFSGVPATDWSWGALFFDMDNDGWNDIYVCNGVNRDVTDLDFMNFFADEVYQKMVLSGQKREIDQLLKQIPRTPLPNKAFKNDKDLRFSDVGELWGLGRPTFSNGAAYGDLDNDGDLDLIVSNENQPSFIYKNNSKEISGNNFIGFELKGSGKNTFAIGSKIKIYSGQQLITRELFPSRGFQSSMDYKQIIGIGNINKIDSVVISWPDRKKSVIDIPKINVIHRVDENNVDKSENPELQNTINTFFKRIDSHFEKHTENEFEDFNRERNIPRKTSKEGPKAAVADVNGDGLDDVYIGGTPGHPGKLYLQKIEGEFVYSEQKSFQQYSDFEDVAVLFFDYDNDKDQDLLVCPGGNVSLPPSRELQLRLFENDGKGNFSINTSAFPTCDVNVSVAIANDFNNDGFEDLFIGGRNVPGLYGADPASYIFQNDGNKHFIDVAAKNNPEISKIGMVCGAVWADVAEDQQKELIIVGEWMTPRIFGYHNDKFKEIQTNLSDLNGWWQTINISDVNGDGKMDLLLGNIGENFYLKPDKNNPVKLWINDYDQNSSIEKVMSYTVNEKDLPVFLKKDMEDQLPVVKKENLKNGIYADKTIQQLFSKELLSGAQVKKFTYPKSCIAINNGNGNFTVKELPDMCQLSCINVFYPIDLNHDNLPDLVTGGNQFGFLPQFERLDASFGDVLINKGDGSFSWQQDASTGINLRGEMRDIVLIKGRNKKYLLFLQNNEYPALFEINN